MFFQEKISLNKLLFLQRECHWYCAQANYTRLSENMFSEKNTREALFRPHGDEITKDCDCKNLLDKDRSSDIFLHVPLEYDPQFDEKVNMNISIIKFATNVWERGKFQKMIYFRQFLCF